MQKTTQSISIAFSILGHILKYFVESELNINLTCYYLLFKSLDIENMILSVSIFGLHYSLTWFFTEKVGHDPSHCEF